MKIFEREKGFEPSKSPSRNQARSLIFLVQESESLLLSLAGAFATSHPD